jgi:hypothetical protein
MVNLCMYVYCWLLMLHSTCHLKVRLVARARPENLEKSMMLGWSLTGALKLTKLPRVYCICAIEYVYNIFIHIYIHNILNIFWFGKSWIWTFDGIWWPNKSGVHVMKLMFLSNRIYPTSWEIHFSELRLGKDDIDYIRLLCQCRKTQ